MNSTIRSRRGVALIYVLTIFTVLIGLAAFAADYGLIRMTKVNLQSAVESATLAAGSGLSVSPTEARNRAKTIAASNFVNGSALILLDSDIELGMWNANTRQFTLVTGTGESLADAVRITGCLQGSRSSGVKLSFIPLLSGKQSVDLTASSVATRTTPSEDVVVVQDVSGSFSGEISYARQGDRDLLDSMAATVNTSSFGLVAFTGTGKTIASLKKVNGNYNSLKSAVNSLGVGTSGMPSTSSGTDIAAGIERAQAVFDAYPVTTNTRSMVIVSDGLPTSDWQNAHPGLSAAQLLVEAQQDADTAWAKGINVFVVFWDQNNSTTAANNLKSLVRGRGVFVHVTDPTRISESISNVMQSTRLVK